MLITLLPVLKRLDRIVLLLINHDSDSVFLDPLMLALRDPITWIPVYVVLLWYVIKLLGQGSIPFVILSILVVSITDIGCYRVLKPFFERVRPCNDPELLGLLRILVDCGGSYSFPSNHAANHFSLATFCFLYFKELTSKRWHWLWVWASSIGYAQIYVGKHFPSDIMGGAFVGMLVGILIYKYKRQITLWTKNQ
jgi:membrane-associated phospholipid phosphatase